MTPLPSAPSPEEAPKSRDPIENAIAILNQTGYGEAANRLRVACASDSRVVSPSAGARMSELPREVVGRLVAMAEYVLREADGYEGIEHDAHAVQVAKEWLVGPSQPSTDTAEEGR